MVAVAVIVGAEVTLLAGEQTAVPWLSTVVTVLAGGQAAEAWLSTVAPLVRLYITLFAPKSNGAKTSAPPMPTVDLLHFEPL